MFADGRRDGFIGWWEQLGAYQLPVVMGVVLVVGLAVVAPFLLPWGEEEEVTQPAQPEPAQPRPSADMRKMYDRVGVDAIRVAVDQFYNRVLADPRLAKYFQHLGEADLRSLRVHQARFVGQLLGGPIQCTPENLRRAHAGLKITTDDYWLTVAHMLAVLTGLGVDEDIVVYVGGHLIRARKLIVTN